MVRVQKSGCTYLVYNLCMMMIAQAEILINNLVLLKSNKYMGLYADASGKKLVCQIQASYVPYDYFKNSFREYAEIIAQKPVERFVFDKRSLRAFHQPSMEWYFIEWKQALYRNHDLRIHRKILPDEAWFQKCVEAGRAEIFKKHPNSCLQELDIRYAESITEALQL